jgi:hypothetical protein
MIKAESVSPCAIGMYRFLTLGAVILAIPFDNKRFAQEFITKSAEEP